MKWMKMAWIANCQAKPGGPAVDSLLELLTEFHFTLRLKKCNLISVTHR